MDDLPTVRTNGYHFIPNIASARTAARANYVIKKHIMDGLPPNKPADKSDRPDEWLSFYSEYRVRTDGSPCLLNLQEIFWDGLPPNKPADKSDRPDEWLLFYSDYCVGTDGSPCLLNLQEIFWDGLPTVPTQKM
jgi:hypothetical protein